MHRLNVNPATLAMALNTLTGTPDQIAYFSAQLTRSCATELTLYQSTPPADAPPEVVQAVAATGKTDWGDMVHPYVIGQILVDLCERTNQPCPDNLFVYVAPDWVPLHNVQPSAPPKPVAPPVPVPALTPAQMASPQPDLVRTEVMGATILKAAPQATQPQVSMPHQPLQAAATTFEQLIDQAVAAPAPAPAPTPTPYVVEDAEFTPAVQAQNAPQPPAQTQAATTPPAQPGDGPFVRGAYDLPLPETAATKGKSPFDTAPDAKVPATPPDRVIRDWVTMSRQLFAIPPAQLLKGDGKGIPQRTRAFLALLLLVDQALESAPDDQIPVGLLRHHIAQLRYNASQSAAGPAMLAYETYLFKAAE